MSDINEFVRKMGDDIGQTFAPRVESQVVQAGNQIAESAAPKGHEFVDKRIREVFAQQSGPLRDFVIKLIQDLVARYEPVLAGNVHTNIAERAILLTSNDTRVEIKERGTGRLIASLDLPVDFRVEFKDLFVKLDQATLRLDNVQL